MFLNPKNFILVIFRKDLIRDMVSFFLVKMPKPFFMIQRPLKETLKISQFTKVNFQMVKLQDKAL
jgi:hypothetical protein